MCTEDYHENCFIAAFFKRTVAFDFALGIWQTQFQILDYYSSVKDKFHLIRRSTGIRQLLPQHFLTLLHQYIWQAGHHFINGIDNCIGPYHQCVVGKKTLTILGFPQAPLANSSNRCNTLRHWRFLLVLLDDYMGLNFLCYLVIIFF